MTTIEIVREASDAQTVYRAMSGKQQATGVTPGQALDNLEELLVAAEGKQEAGNLVIVQRFRPDSHFTAAQQVRLQELMQRLHEAEARGATLSAEEQEQLEQLVDAEWRAAIKRGEEILSQLPSAD